MRQSHNIGSSCLRLAGLHRSGRKYKSRGDVMQVKASPNITINSQGAGETCGRLEQDTQTAIAMEEPRRSSRKRTPRKPLSPPSPPSIRQKRTAGGRNKKSSKAHPTVTGKPKKRRQQEPLKREYVTHERSVDVLRGRGPSLNKHQGNLAFRERVKLYIPRYVAADKKGKTEICEEIVDVCKAEGICFLQKDKNNGLWYHITRHTARSKAAQTIQDILKRSNRDAYGHCAEDAAFDDEETLSDAENEEGDASEESQLDSSADDEAASDTEQGGEDKDEESDEEDGNLKLPAYAGDNQRSDDTNGALVSAVREVAASAIFPGGHGFSRTSSPTRESPPFQRPEPQLRPAAAPRYLQQFRAGQLKEDDPLSHTEESP